MKLPVNIGSGGFANIRESATPEAPLTKLRFDGYRDDDTDERNHGEEALPRHRPRTELEPHGTSLMPISSEGQAAGA